MTVIAYIDDESLEREIEAGAAALTTKVGISKISTEGNSAALINFPFVMTRIYIDVILRVFDTACASGVLHLVTSCLRIGATSRSAEVSQSPGIYAGYRREI